MSDYEPLDLTRWCNADAAVLAGETPLAVGAQHFHGLPFQIGPADPAAAAACFIAFDRQHGLSPLTLPIGRPAHRVLIAHRLLESQLLDGGPLGVVVADYLFTLADGSVVRVPIRERFEISTARPPWGGLPFASLPDQANRPLPRYEGRWDDAGRRQTEAIQGTPRNYVLWVWANPRPEQALVSLEIIPQGPAFLIAGLTLGQLDEHPFTRAGARPVKITLADPADAAQPFDLSVEVDRGIATYPYALPAADTAAFLADGFAGFGEPQNPASSPAYTEIAAIPSATVTVKHGDEPLGSARWGEVEARGAVETPRLRIELIDPGRNWVRTTVLDEATGRPIPCRVHFRSPDGVPYQPHGHHGHVNSNNGTWHVDVGGDVRLGQATYAYIDGTCQGWLPRGEVIVDVARGFEYEPLRARVTIAPGQQELTLRLRRFRDMNAERWFSGDTHVHFLSTQGSQLEAQGEDLNVVNLLLSQWGNLFTNTEEWNGGQPLVSADRRTIVYATQENRQHMLGHLTLLGLKEPIMPWCSDGPSEAELGGTLEITMSDWADQCHRQGGTVIIPHLPFPNGEPATLIATGRADAVEMIRHQPFNHLEYYRYLNGGYRLPLVGGTDKMSSDVPVGLYRTYVYIPPDEEFTYTSWCRNLTLGRTIHSGGPLLDFTVEGKRIGDTLQLPAGGGTVEVEAQAESIVPIHNLEIIQQGRVVASTSERHGARRLQLKTRLKVDGHSWLAARVGGADYDRPLAYQDCWQRGVFAHTSPIYLACGGDWQLHSRETAQYMLTLIDGTLTYIRDHSPRYQPGTVTHHHGEADHQIYLERPFQQAREAIHRRLHALGIDH